jgi:hypothetical protein
MGQVLGWRLNERVENKKKQKTGKGCAFENEEKNEWEVQRKKGKKRRIVRKLFFLFKPPQSKP